MTWFKVDDALPAHHKVLSIPRGMRRVAAAGAWVLCGAWSSANMKEGRVPLAVIDELAIPARAVADLLAAGLWLPVEGGYQMHDYLDYNPSAEQVTRERQAAVERQRRARERSKGTPSRRDTAVTNGVTHAPVTEQCHGVSHGPPVPARPDPSPKAAPTVLSAATPQAQKGTRIPDEWPPTPDLLAWLAEHCPAVSANTETAQWLDYHRAKGDTAKDWTASWRTWMRNAQKFSQQRPGGQLSLATNRPSTTDQRVTQGLALVEHFQRQEGA